MNSCKILYFPLQTLPQICQFAVDSKRFSSFWHLITWDTDKWILMDSVEDISEQGATRHPIDAIYLSVFTNI